MSTRLLIGVGVVFFLLFFPSVVFADIYINEFLPAPSTGNNEWVEFYNSGETTVDLSDYYFDDDTSFTSDSGNKERIALSGLLAKKSLCYWDLSSFLNNNGDSPTLFHIDGSIKDTYTYTKITTDKTYARVPDGGNWVADQIATKPDVSCSSLAPTQTPTPIPSETPTHTPAPFHTPIPTHTQTPSSTPKKTPTPLLTKKTTITEMRIPSSTISSTMSSEMLSETSEAGDVLGANESSESGNTKGNATPTTSKKPFIVSLIFVSLGSAMLALSFIVKRMMIKM